MSAEAAILPPRASAQKLVLDIVAAYPDGIAKRLLVKQCCGEEPGRRGAIYRALDALVAGGHIALGGDDAVTAAANRSPAPPNPATALRREHSSKPNVDDGTPVAKRPDGDRPPEKRRSRKPQGAQARFLKQEVSLQRGILAILSKARFGLDTEALSAAVDRMFPTKHQRERLEQTLTALQTRGEVRIVGKRWIVPRDMRTQVGLKRQHFGRTS